MRIMLWLASTCSADDAPLQVGASMSTACNPCWYQNLSNNPIHEPSWFASCKSGALCTNAVAHLPLCSGHQSLDDGPSLIVQQVHLQQGHASISIGM
jgi:hypothetical protein